MSIGWMTQVANIPLAPPLTNGLMAVHTVVLFPSAIANRHQQR